jgi:hypothetical protein
LSKTSSSPRPDRGTYTVFCGIDVARKTHHAVALDQAGHRLIDRPLPNAGPDLVALFEELEGHGRVLVVVDQLASRGALAIASRSRGITVAYLPGLAMRRIARPRMATPLTVGQPRRGTGERPGVALPS